MANLRSHETFPVRAWELMAYISITVMGITGNSLVLGVLRQNRQMRESPFGVYIKSLALADILVSTLCLPVYVTSTSAFKAHPKGLSGDVLCKLWTGYFALFYFAVISVYTLVALSVERYYAICHPVKAKVKSTPSRAKKIVVVIWICSFIPNFALIAGLESASSGNGSFGAHCIAIAFKDEVVWKIFYVTVFTLQYIIPISCMVVCFVKIKKVLNTTKVNTFASAHNTQLGQLSIIKRRRKTVMTIMIMIVSYLSCWSLNQALYFLLNLGHGFPWNGNLMQLSVVLCFFSSCINPAIYAIRSKEFRDGFAKMLFCS